MKRYKIYGTLKDQFVGFIQADSMENKSSSSEAFYLAKDALAERGIEVTNAVGVPVDKDESEPMKNLGTTVNFLYSKDCDFGSELVAGMPTITIYDQSQNEEYTSIGFGDVDIAEQMLEKLVRVVEYLKSK